MCSSVGGLSEVNCIQQSWIEGIVGVERLIRHFFHIHWTHLRNIGALETRQGYMHTHTFCMLYTHTNPFSLIYAQMCSHKTTSDIGGPLQKHVSWSDLWLFYRAVVADCSDVGLIHQCQCTLSHMHTNITTHTLKYMLKTDRIVLIPFEVFWPSALLPSQEGQRSDVDPVKLVEFLGLGLVSRPSAL